MKQLLALWLNIIKFPHGSQPDSRRLLMQGEESPGSIG